MTEKRQINRSEPTEADKQAASVLRAAWEKKKKTSAEVLTQTWLGEQIGITQGGVGHYLNGNRRFGLEALLAFCHVLDLNPMEVHPEVASGLFAADEMTVEYISLYRKAPENVKEAVLVLLRSSEQL